MTQRLQLPSVTLCAAASVNITATVAALQRCLDQVEFGRTVLFSNTRPTGLPSAIDWVQIAPLRSANAYSRFVLNQLAPEIATPHCLIAQWDGFVIDAAAWDPAFLDLDYVGAPWPQFDDGHDVGNGGFSHAGLTNQNRIVLSAATQNLQNPSDFFVAANHGV